VNKIAAFFFLFISFPLPHVFFMGAKQTTNQIFSPHQIQSENQNHEPLLYFEKISLIFLKRIEK